jgi:hypothetical protein
MYRLNEEVKRGKSSGDEREREEEEEVLKSLASGILYTYVPGNSRHSCL